MSKLHDLWLVLKGELSSRQVVNLQGRLTYWETRYNFWQRQVSLWENEVRPVLQGIGRVLANDKAFIADYDDPIRRAESDRLGMNAINRLKAEDDARRHTTGGF